MRKLIFYTIFALLLVAMVYFYVGRVAAPSFNLKNGETDYLTYGWIEILSSSVLIKDDNEIVGREIYNGDKLPAPITIITDASGGANIHFPNGSIVRLDASTEVELQKVDFDNNKKSLKVNLALRVGRLWSKVIGLTVGDSYWEIKTSNVAVAASKAAFGVEYAQGGTLLVVSENKAGLTVVDPENGQPLANSTAVVPAKKTMQIQDADIEDLKKGKITLNFFVQDAVPSIWRQPWVERAISQDESINNKIEGLKNGGLNDWEIQSVLIKDNAQEMKNQIANRVTDN